MQNYLISLYAKQKDETPLLNFIIQQSKYGEPVYDYKYALRLCHQENKTLSCVHIYSLRGFFQEAVQLALTIDVDTAEQVAKEADISNEERKKLYLIIIKYVIEVKQDMNKAMSLLKEEDEIKIEDILPYIPDMTTMGHIKHEIISSLSSYNSLIDSLKSTLDHFTHSAALVRKDISEIRNRSAFVTNNQRCDLCSQPVLTRPFHLFACTHVYHVDCLASSVKSYLIAHPRLLNDKKCTYGSVLHQFRSAQHKSIKNSSTNSTIPHLTNKEIEDVLENRSLLEEIAASECIMCGSVMIDSVQDPFILPSESSLVASWQL